MSDNSWYDKFELPPAGTKCIIDSIMCIDGHARSFHGMEVDIHFHMVDHEGDEIAVFSMVDQKERDCLKFHGMMRNCFRPIKTEREISIDDIAGLISKGSVGTYMGIAEKLYDAGYRKIKSEI